MSDDFTADVHELNQVVVDLTRASGTVGEKASAVVRKSAFDIETTSKILAPVDTGALRNSIGTDIVGEGTSPVVEAQIGPTVNYGAYVEFGTSRMAPKAYMGPALDRHAPGFVAALEQIAGDVL